MSVTPEEAARVWVEADLLHSPQAVQIALDRMAGQIAERLRDCNPLVLCVLTGAIVATGQLLTRLDFPLELDYLHATRYRGATSGSELHWLAPCRTDMAGRSVLIVDDILDEGITLKAIREYCLAEGAREVLCAALVDKRHERKNGMQADFVGLEVADRYVFGAGMDYKGFLRNAAGIYAVKGM